ncbi:hypothetical protein AB9Q10_27335 [Streptomyces krungchingensis]|uniref:hypothetical protein n=1 Tax=Streptomyces krungchingensis TaxID=1565034 RepID=UPI003CFAF834
MTSAERSATDRQGLTYYPWWLDNLADDATLEGGAMNGTARGAEAVRAIVVKARELYEFQDFSYAGDFGDNGFLEIYDASVKSEPLKVVVTVTRNAAGQAQDLAVLHRPRNSLLLFSRLMHERFAGTPLAEHFLSDDS